MQGSGGITGACSRNAQRSSLTWTSSPLPRAPRSPAGAKGGADRCADQRYNASHLVRDQSSRPASRPASATSLRGVEPEAPQAWPAVDDPRSTSSTACLRRTTTNRRIHAAFVCAAVTVCRAPCARRAVQRATSSMPSSTTKWTSGSADSQRPLQIGSRPPTTVAISKNLRVVRRRLDRTYKTDKVCSAGNPSKRRAHFIHANQQPPGRPRLTSTNATTASRYLDYAWAPLTCQEKARWVNAKQQLQPSEVRLPSGEQTEAAIGKVKRQGPHRSRGRGRSGDRSCPMN